MGRTRINYSPPPLPKNNNKEKRRKYPPLSCKDVINTIKSKCVRTNILTYGKGKSSVVILPEAWEQLKHIIDWGKKTPINMLEQLYKGVGHCFIDPKGGVTLVISRFFYIYAAHRTATSACLFDGEFDSIMKRISNEISIYNQNELSYNQNNGCVFDPFVSKYGKSEELLYGHTHPNLGVFFSAPDKTSGFANPELPAAIFVADPIRKELKAALGVNLEEARIIVCEYYNNIIKEEVEIPISQNESHKQETYKSKTMEELISDFCLVYQRVLDFNENIKGHLSIRTRKRKGEQIKIILNRPIRRKKKKTKKQQDQKEVQDNE